MLPVATSPVSGFVSNTVPVVTLPLSTICSKLEAILERREPSPMKRVACTLFVTPKPPAIFTAPVNTDVESVVSVTSRLSTVPKFALCAYNFLEIPTPPATLREPVDVEEESVASQILARPPTFRFDAPAIPPATISAPTSGYMSVVARLFSIAT